MKVIGLLMSMMVVAVGAWARYQAHATYDPLHSKQNNAQCLPLGQIDDVFYEQSCNSLVSRGKRQHDDRKPYQPRPAVSSGVQTNPFLEADAGDE